MDCSPLVIGLDTRKDIKRHCTVAHHTCILFIFHRNFMETKHHVYKTLSGIGRFKPGIGITNRLYSVLVYFYLCAWILLGWLLLYFRSPMCMELMSLAAFIFQVPGCCNIILKLFDFYKLFNWDVVCNDCLYFYKSFIN